MYTHAHEFFKKEMRKNLFESSVGIQLVVECLLSMHEPEHSAQYHRDKPSARLLGN